MGTTAAIEVHGLVKRYGESAVVAGLDLSVPAGELVALLGPNGAGKSTTVEILEGLRRPDSGVVQVLGTTPWRGSPRWRSRIGVVLQEATDFPELTVQECVDQLRAYYPQPAAAAGLLGDVGLADQRRERVRSLSGGQRRRLDVALALLPLTWLARGMRSAFLPEHLALVESGGQWQLWGTAAVLLGWAVLGLVVSLRTFRWTAR